ncbi:MAG: histidine phosphatase family protein [Candidatus Bathyarchaeota archaeon]|nr:histidine phosphatase family protein [Candidatus Bathyarchaeota archaeon]
MPILLIRHGEAVSNVDPEVGSWHDPPLTPKGRQQATALAQRLQKSIGSDCKLYTSHRKRALETAEIIAQHINVEPIIEPELDEYRHGLSPTTTMEESKTYWTEKCDPIRDWRPYSCGESVEEIFKRAGEVIEKIDPECDNWSLVVSHSYLIDKIISYWIGIPIDTLQHFVFSTTNTGATLLTYRQGDRIIKHMNDTLHLGESFETILDSK